MKLVKMISVDMHEGILKNKKVLFIPMLLGIVTFADFYIRGCRLEMQGNLTWGDWFFYVYGGMEVYIPSLTDRFEFPSVWLLIFCLCAYAVLDYPVNSVEPRGVQLLVRSGQRKRWYLSKIIWNSVATIYFHVILGLTAGVCILICGEAATPSVHIELLRMLLKCKMDEVTVECITIPFMWCVLPVVVSLALNMMQMTVSFFVKPVFCFGAVCIWLVASAYIYHPIMFGSFGMLLRADWIQAGGLSANGAIAGMGAACICAAVIGMIHFCRHYDLLSKGW